MTFVAEQYSYIVGLDTHVPGPQILSARRHRWGRDRAGHISITGAGKGLAGPWPQGSLARQRRTVVTWAAVSCRAPSSLTAPGCI